jgi:hypothetical protein
MRNAWLLAMLIVLVGVAGCKKGTPSSDLLGDQKGSAAGVTWNIPKAWKVGPERQMRAATYLVDPQSGDAEGAECAVFYFGQGVGGDPESNIQRWLSQFEEPQTPKSEAKEIGGIPVTLVQINGTYLAPSGPMMMSSGKKENFRLMGAIVMGPQGTVFFKMTGPVKTITASASAFDAMVGSLTK